jgi:hypothetical protein
VAQPETISDYVERHFMKPIAFACRETIPQKPEAISSQILELANWTDFRGYGPLPGIKSAEFERRTPDIVGSRIRVTNSDGSSHVEEIVEWQPQRRVRLRFHRFSPPVSRLAREFFETWQFERAGEVTAVTRSFELHGKSILAWPVLWAVSFFLRRAVRRHLLEMKAEA